MTTISAIQAQANGPYLVPVTGFRLEREVSQVLAHSMKRGPAGALFSFTLFAEIQRNREAA